MKYNRVLITSSLLHFYIDEAVEVWENNLTKHFIIKTLQLIRSCLLINKLLLQTPKTNYTGVYTLE